MEKEYSRIRSDVTGFYTFDSMVAAARQLRFQSTPGYPYCLEKPTIGEWLGFDGLQFDQERLFMLWRDIQNVVDNGFEHVYWKVFIKQEVHKKSKAETGRWRLIVCPPLHVQLLWQMCFSEMNSKEVDYARLLPSKQGMILPGGGWKHYHAEWKQGQLSYGTDCSAWDWTVPGWMLKLDLELRKRLTYGQDTDTWTRIATALYRDAYRDCKLLLSSGMVYQQQFWGVQKSGCVNTISTNSHGQVMTHLLYAYEKGISHLPWPACVGDDKLQSEEFVQDLSVYEQYGIVIKEVTLDYEFVGHKFTDDGPIPSYLTKHLWNLIHTSEDILEDVMDSYCCLYANDPMVFDFWLKVARNLRIEHTLRSPQYYKFWYNNPDGLDKGFRRELPW